MNGYEMEVTEVKIPVPWGHISGKWFGPMEMQPIVALHGWQDNLGSFARLAESLLPDVAILSIDLPGHGLSSHLPTGQYYYLFWDGVVNLRRIVKFYKWDKVKLLGHSLGGAIGFMYAGIYPREVDFLICLDIAGPVVKKLGEIVSQTGACVDKFLTYDSATADSAPSQSYDQMLSVVEDAYNGSITTESAEILMKRGARLTAAGDMYSFTRDPRLKVSIMGTISMDMVYEYASRIECPYMNIRALNGITLASGLDTYESVVNKIKQNSRKFRYHEVEGTHHVHLNEPRKVAALIRNFLFS